MVALNWGTKQIGLKVRISSRSGYGLRWKFEISTLWIGLSSIITQANHEFQFGSIKISFIEKECLGFNEYFTIYH